MAEILLGKPVADAMVEDVSARAAALVAAGNAPKLAIVRVGERPDDLTYERSAMKRADACGIAVEQVILPADANTAQIIAAVERVNGDDSIHGCLLFRPLPKGVDEDAVCNALDPAKDIDGITRGSRATLLGGQGEGYAPCTAAACIDILDHYGIQLDGKNAVVLGRSLVIGKPVALMLLERNATVTICHSHTANLAQVASAADIVVCATGRARAYGADYFQAGQTVLDVGINFDEEGALCGDVDFDAVEPIVGAITPVPRGVGSVTTVAMLRNVVVAAEKQGK
jgi:methylenetetrahydrofolate dehydrogenase (NADP+) / methenyltetrahydrofolate cyclohydrolase